jgi:hypothetical protein
MEVFPMRKTALFCLLFCLLISVPAFSADPLPTIDIKELQTTMDTFATELALSLPFNSSMGLNWSDAHIGQLIDKKPPFFHFGVGFSAGFTTMELTSFNKLIGFFAPALPDWVKDFGGFPMPGYAVEARIGGLILPFDVGVKFGILPIESEQFQKLDYTLVGADFRYRLLEDKGAAPGISVGVGLSYLKGGLGMTAGADTSIAYEYPDLENPTVPPTMIPATLTLKAPELDLFWETASLDFKVQISKKILIITPYLGLGASNGWSNAGYKVTTRMEDSGGNLDLDMLRPIMSQFGLEGFSEDGFGSSAEFTGWSFRVYGGFSINLPFVRIEFTGLYNFIDEKYGATIGARFQI